MKSIIKSNIYTVLVIISLLASCGNPEATKNDGSSLVDAVTFTETQTRYIAAAGGLRMREQASLDAPKLNVVPYGKKVQVVSSDAAPISPISGLSGEMVKVMYGKKQGYVFSGYLSSVPMPQKGQFPEDYIKELESQGVDARYSYNMADDELSDETIINLPVNSFQEAFLIAQRLNMFDCDFDLPDPVQPSEMTVRVKKNVSARIKTSQQPEGDYDLYYNLPTNASNPDPQAAAYWMRTVSLNRDANQKAFNYLYFVTAYEGGSFGVEIKPQGNYYSITKEAVAD